MTDASTASLVNRCPVCGSECHVQEYAVLGSHIVVCSVCPWPIAATEAEALAMHNSYAPEPWCKWKGDETFEPGRIFDLVARIGVPGTECIRMAMIFDLRTRWWQYTNGKFLPENWTVLLYRPHNYPRTPRELLDEPQNKPVS